MRKVVVAGVASMVSALALATGVVAEEAVENADKTAAWPKTLSLADLMNVEVVSASRHSTSLMKTPAAVYVITEDDINRSGATTLPDALRLAPGVDVAKIDAARYAVSIRGFTSQFSNKLLVLIDGRSVYKPLFAGTTWETQDLLLSDIDRIEVIRGPGASTWGANAVNGVINIVTKNSSQTQGNRVSFLGGNEEEWTGTGRHGGKLGENATYRVYAKAFERDGGVDANGNDLPDLWRQSRTGFRIDAEPTAWDFLMVEGDLYQSESQLAGRSPRLPGKIITSDVDSEGGYVLSSWTRVFSSTSKMIVRGYVDHGDRDVEEGLQEERTAYDLDAQHDFALGSRQQITYGLAANVSDDSTSDSPTVSYDPNDRTLETYSTFLQDDITLAPDTLLLTIGAKLEHHEYTDWEFQPTARLLFSPTDKQSVWASVSRAVRTPSRAEREGNSILNVVTSTKPPEAWRALGNDDVISEDLTAYELGYRVEATERLFTDIALFYNDYDNLISLERGTSIPGATTVNVPYNGDNNLVAESYGGEVSAQWQALDTWRLTAAYSYLNTDGDTTGGSTDKASVARDEGDPENQISLRSAMDLSRTVQFDLTIRYVDEREARRIDDYTALDARLAWRARKDVEFALVGQNLLDPQHPEFGSQYANVLSTEVERSLYGKVTCWF